MEILSTAKKENMLAEYLVVRLDNSMVVQMVSKMVDNLVAWMEG